MTTNLQTLEMESSDKDVTDTEANKDNKTGNTEPKDNAMDVKTGKRNQVNSKKKTQYLKHFTMCKARKILKYC